MNRDSGQLLCISIGLLRQPVSAAGSADTFYILQ